ncbi:MAG TPA: YihY/virulence factor BrkB family protein [Nocardioidaceae bacterium]|jgi:membrane protein|nr:YihY/virulence factor BrkB family protein [Nocardioidaceae bacterium]
MASLKQRLTARVDRARRRWPAFDHVVRTVQHYGEVEGNSQAGAVTYFGFLSFFPILALGFFVVGYVSKVYPQAQDQLVKALDEVLPGVVGNGAGEIPISDFESYAGAVGIVGVVGLLYSGLGWLSGMRNAFEVMFRLPKREQPGFVVGKARDLATLATIGITLIVSVALSGAVAGASRQILTWVGLDPDSLLPNALLWVIAHALAIAATTGLLLAMYRLLADPHLPRRALVEGALLGAVGFEILKSVANFLIALTQQQPAFQAFGVALILLVWINYFSRLVMYSAAYAHTSPLVGPYHGRTAGLTPVTAPPEQRPSGRPGPMAAPAASPFAAVSPDLPGAGTPLPAEPQTRRRWGRALAAVGAAAGALAAGAAVVRRQRGD